MKTIYLIAGIALLIITGWLIPIDGPFDIKPEEVIEQYQETHRPASINVPVIKKQNLTEEEIEYLEEFYQMQYEKMYLIEGEDY